MRALASKAVWLCAGALAAGALAGSPAPARAAGPPLIEATWVSDVTASAASLRAEINPNGPVSTYRFEYISAAAYDANLAAQPPREGFFGAARAPGAQEAGDPPAQGRR